jgi:hypothetical protein
MRTKSSSTLLSIQKGRVVFGFALFFLGGLLMWIHGPIETFFQWESYIAQLLGTAIIFVAFAWLCIAVRCPQCGLRLFWYAVSSKECGSWFGWLLNNSCCPKCGFAGKDRKIHEPARKE